MLIYSSRPHTRLAAPASFVLLLGAWFAVACGGRSTSDGSSGVSGASGAVGVSGSVGDAGAHSAAGAGAGAVTSEAGEGGAVDVCGTVNCPAIICPVNTAPVLLAGNCCQTCQSTCTEPCASCGPGFHAVMHSNVCCPSCEADVPTTPSCEAGEMTYAAARAQMLEKYSTGCSVDQDCIALAPSNRCEGGCGYGALLASVANNWPSNLESEANRDCVNCPPQGSAKCFVPGPPVCVKNVCQLP